MQRSVPWSFLKIPLCLGFAAADAQMHWFTGLWMSEESVGDAGASSLGYFGGCFSPDGSAIVAHGFTGALHLWRRAGVAMLIDTQARMV